MKHLIISIALISSVCLPSQAQENALKVPYSRLMPAVIRARVPRGYQSRFFGRVNIATRSNDLLLHLYEGAIKSTSVSKSTNYPVSKQDVVLDLFTHVGAAKKRRLQLVNSIHLDSEIKFFDSFGVKIMWLLPAKRQTPIIKIKSQVKDGFYGPYGNEILVIFSKGLGNKPTVQQFDYWSTHNGYVQTSYDKVDERGFLMVTREQGEDTGGAYVPDNPKVVDLQWNGEAFTAKDEKSRSSQSTEK